MNDSKQRKLKRYWIDGGLCEMEPRGVFAECVHRIYLQDEADAVIFALEAENERLEEELEDMLNLLGRLYRGNKELLRHGTWDKVKAILNRAQEKQP